MPDVWAWPLFEPEKYQEAFPGMLSGGIIGTLLDGHCNGRQHIT